MSTQIYTKTTLNQKALSQELYIPIEETIQQKMKHNTVLTKEEPNLSKLYKIHIEIHIKSNIWYKDVDEEETDKDTINNAKWILCNDYIEDSEIINLEKITAKEIYKDLQNRIAIPYIEISEIKKWIKNEMEEPLYIGIIPYYDYPSFRCHNTRSEIYLEAIKTIKPKGETKWA